MHRERLSEDIFVFTSSLYAQVTASLIVAPEGCVVIDTLPFPSETRQIVEFAARTTSGVQHVILSHYHADHVYGACQFSAAFPTAQFIGQAQCKQLLIERGQAGLRAAQANTPELNSVELRLPDVVFNEEMTLRFGMRTLQLVHLPGHSNDLLGVFIKEDKVLFASDAMMPLPHIVDGNTAQMIDSLRRIKALNLEIIVQGHGEMILRGEIADMINSNIKYLETLQSRVTKLVAGGKSRAALAEITLESCGKNRIALNGLVQRLHAENALALYNQTSR
jgi:glyoxylase-like metal-dependent hydrolase (beta-lactamase superfamily II)